MKVKSRSEVAQSCPTLSDPMDCSPPGSSVRGIFQARVLEWGAVAFSVCVYVCIYIYIYIYRYRCKLILSNYIFILSFLTKTVGPFVLYSPAYTLSFGECLELKN